MQPQRLGDFVAVEVLSETSLGTLYKALPAEGEPRLLFVKAFAPSIAACAPAATLLQTHAARWAALQDLYTLHMESLQFAGEQLVASFEYRQGRLLSDILRRCEREGIPVAPDQAVYLAERIAGALVSLSTQDQFAGALSPEEILVTFEGEVKLFPSLGRDLSTTDLRAGGDLNALLAYQSADVRGGKKAKSSADRFALGALLYEFLLHQPLRPEGAEVDLKSRIEEAKAGMGMSEPLPPKLADVLEKSLLPSVPGAYESIDAFKADLDALITSGEYSPSTFNMAFLMHTLFRDEDEAETQKDAAWLALDRTPFLPPPPAASEEPAEKPKPKKRFVMPPPVVEDVTQANFTVAEEPSRKGLWISLGATGVVVVIAVLAYLAFGRNSGPNEAEIRAQYEAKLATERAELKKQQDDLAQKLAAAQQEKADLEAKAAGAKTAEERVQAQKALEEAKKKIEEQRQQAAALEQKAAAVPATGTPPPAEPPKSSPTTTPSVTSTPAATQPGEPSGTPATSPGTEIAPPSEVTPPVSTAPSGGTVRPGDFVELFAVSAKPREVQGLKVEYTQQARANRLQGTIYIEVDIDETGAVTGARTVRAPNPDYGMGDELVRAAQQMRYTPAIKDGVPVKTKLTFPVRLEMKAAKIERGTKG